MPRGSVVAKNYAKALFQAAKKTDSIDKIIEELEVFKDNFSTSFAAELKNPVVSKNDSIKIIQAVTEKFALSKLTSSFFASIVKNRRLNLFPEIYEEFSRMIKQFKKVLEVELITAIKANKAQVEKIKSLLEKKYPGKTVIIKEIITAKVIGGFQVKVGSEIIDVSLKNQFTNIGKKLLSATN